MRATWRLVLALLPIGGALVAALCGLELAGIVPRGALIGSAGDGERWVAVAFGLLVRPFGISALRHARLVIDGDAVHYLGFGFVCRPRTILFADVRRFGHAIVTNRGRRERHLAFDLGSGDVRTVKLAMYADPDRILELLTARLGAPAATAVTLRGVHFVD